jgi:hypothetical protein
MKSKDYGSQKKRTFLGVLTTFGRNINTRHSLPIVATSRQEYLLRTLYSSRKQGAQAPYIAIRWDL